MTQRSAPEGDHTVISTQKARSGETSGHLRIILVVSLSLTVIGMGVVLLIWTSGA